MVNTNKPKENREKLFGVYSALSELGEIDRVFGGEQVERLESLKSTHYWFRRPSHDQVRHSLPEG
jgi:hypothetical protein